MKSLTRRCATLGDGRVKPSMNWPSLIAELEARGVDICTELHVDPSTVWRWKTRTSKPSGDHAAELLKLMAGIAALLPASSGSGTIARFAPTCD